MESKQFFDQLSRARREQADTHADDVTDIANAATPSNAHAQKVKIQARQWTAAVQNRQKYGDQPGTAVQVNVGRPQDELDRETLLLETARNIGFILTSADVIKHDREVLALPSPAIARKGENDALPYEPATQTAPSTKPSTEQPAVSEPEQAQPDAAQPEPEPADPLGEWLSQQAEASQQAPRRDSNLPSTYSSGRRPLSRR